MKGFGNKLLKKILESSTQKGINLKKIFYYIVNESGLTRTEIAEKTGLKLSTCGRLIDELMELNLIYECGEAESSGGRRAKKYDVKANNNFLIGVDISRTKVNVLLLEINLEIVAEEKFEMNHLFTPDVTLMKITECINRLLHMNGIELDAVLGIGISSIGPLDIDAGVIINPQQFPAPGWKNVEVVKQLKEHFNLPIILCYGEHSALVAEHRLGAVKGCVNALHINKGIGTRLGLLLNGVVVRLSNAQGALGQGHMVVEIAGRKCSCGNYGCLNAYTTIPAILGEVKKKLKKGDDSLLKYKVKDISNVKFTDVVYAVNNDDPLTKQVIKEAALYSATGLSNLINLFQPEKIVLSGPVYRELPLYYEIAIEKSKERYKRLYPDLHVVFSQGELGENAVAIGAGGLLFDTLFEK